MNRLFDPELTLLIQAVLTTRGLVPRWEVSPAEPLDEERLLDLAERHKVLRLLNRWTKAHPGRLTKATEGVLKTKARVSLIRQQMMVQEGLALAAKLEALGWTVLVLKGPALAAQFCGDPLEREYWDVDLLVTGINPRSFIPAMAKLGYSPCEPEASLSQDGLEYHLSTIHHLGFLGPHGVHIELHHRAWKNGRDMFSPSLPDLVRRSVRLETSLGSFRTLGPVDHAVYVVAHACSHGLCLLSWVLDCGVIPDRLGAPEAKREYLLRVPRTQAAVVWGVLDALSVQNPQAGEEERARLSGRVASLVGFSLHRLRDAGADMQNRNILLWFQLFYLGSFEGLAWRHWLQVIFKPSLRDYLVLPLKRRWFFLYWMLRPVLILFRLTGFRKTTP